MLLIEPTFYMRYFFFYIFKNPIVIQIFLKILNKQFKTSKTLSLAQQYRWFSETK